MAGNDFDREILNPFERPLADDINSAQSQLDRSVRDALRALFSVAGVPQSGFLDVGLKVTQSGVPAMSVDVQPGLGFQDNAGDVPTSIGGVVGLDDLSPYKPLPLSAVQTVAVDAAPGAGNERWDIVEVRADRRAENPSARDVLNTVTGVFAPGLVDKTLAFDLLGRSGRVVSPANSTTGIGYKVGVVAAVGFAVVPATSPGYVKICEIYVGPAVVTIVNANITDRRTILGTTPGDGTVTTAKIVNASVTRPKLAAVGQQVSGSSGAFSTSSAAYVDVTNMTVTITTSGRPVVLAVRPDGSGSSSYLQMPVGSIEELALVRDGVVIAEWRYTSTAATKLSTGIVYLDAPAAGAHTYKIQARIDVNALTLVNVELLAYEL